MGASEGPGIVVRSVHLISHGCVFLRQDGRPKGSVAEPGPSPGALSLGPDVLQGRVAARAGLVLSWSCSRSHQGAGGAVGWLRGRLSIPVTGRGN